jgi:cobalt-zinc-cadmium efflux system membrane fusion protein
MTVRNKRHAYLVAVIVVLAAAALIYRLRPKEAVNAEAAPARDVPYLDGPFIRYSAEFARRAQLDFTPVVRTPLAPIVSVTGTVAFDPERVAAVGARIAGRVRALHKLEGGTVAAGEVLADIESAELGQAQAAVLSARAHATAATANEKREIELAQAKISSNREAELATAQAVTARAELQAAEQRVRALGGDAEGEPGVLRLRSPISGKVVERGVSRGQSVEATHTAYRVADLSRLWVQLAVFERQLYAVQKGDAVDISVENDAQRTVRGSVAYVGDVIDPDTRTAPVRVVVESPEIPLRPGQSVLAQIHTSPKASGSLAVPREAVTSVDGKPTVFVAKEAYVVEPRQIAIGGQDGQRLEVLSALQEGEQIAKSGVFALKSEIFR